MSAALPAKLRALAARRGEKLTRQDEAVLIQAANALDEAARQLKRHTTIYSDSLHECVDNRIRLNGLIEAIEAAIEEARG